MNEWMDGWMTSEMSFKVRPSKSSDIEQLTKIPDGTFEKNRIQRRCCP